MKIIKASKRITPPHPEITELINTILDTPTNDLAALIGGIPEWRWPRSDLGNWIKVLNKFDVILQDIIAEYDIDSLQLKELTSSAKSTVLEVLRFERMLLENSTSRKLYSSYDRLNSLLFSSDLDVVLASLKVILRPSQQYSAQPPSSHTTNISSARLLSLAQSWTSLREQGVELHDFLDKKKPHITLELTGESGDANLQFYRKSNDTSESTITAEPNAPSTSTPISSENTQRDATGSSSQGPSQPTPSTSAKAQTPGLTTVHIPGVASSSKNSMVIVAETHEKHDLPVQERFDLLCKIRIIKAMGKGNEVDRSKLAAIKLLAIAIYSHTHSESQAMTTLFLYDPELVNHVAELIHPDRDIDLTVQIAALVALDGLGRYRTKVLEVLGAVNAGVSHGILLSQLRRTAVHLGDPDSGITNEFAEALLSLFILLISSQGAGNMIVGAGMIPLLVQMIETKTPSRLPVISKTMVLLDSALYGFAAAFQIFCNNRGVDAVVDRIEHEVDYNISEHKDKTEITNAVQSYGRLAYNRSSVLKHLLRSMHRMMQASGASEGLRTLIDSSLPKSIKKIMENRVTFGPPIFSISINLMSIFVHNEPTSLAILQEQKLPETFFNAIESGIEPALEVMNAIPNAIGALCLNAAGEAEFSARTKIIPSIFATFTSEKHLKALGDKDNAVMIGTAIDELVRHHPSLKSRIFEGVQGMLSKIEEMGKAWVPPKGEEKHYILLSPENVTEESSAVDMDTEIPPAPTPGGEAITGEEAAKEESSAPKPPENVILSFIDVAVKLLEGLFQHTPHCRDFIVTYHGIESLGRLLTLPCLPIHFSESPAADSLIQAFRTMAELAPKETLSRLSHLTLTAMDATRDVWDTTSVESRFSRFINISGSKDIETLNTQFRKLATLQITVGLLADVYQTAGYSHVRSVTTILQILTGAEGPEIIEDLGKLHRTFFWESTILKSTLSLSTSAEKAAETSVAESTTGEVTPSVSNVAAGQGQSSSGVATAEAPSTQPSSPAEENNRKALKFIISQIPTALTPFFQAIVKMFMSSRRNSEPPLKALSASLAERVAKVMVEHCRWRQADDPKSFFAYESLVISLISVLFCDERTSQNTLHTLLLLVFYRAGGVDAVLEVGQRCFDSVDLIVKVPRQDRTPAQETELAYAFGAMNVVVHLLHLLVSSKPILDSNQTSPLITRDKEKTDPLYFEPHDFLVKMRLISFPLIRDIWMSSWLSNAPLITLRSAINTVVEIMAAEHENTPPSTPSEHVHIIGGAVPPPRQGPDEATITQLVDMGFTRGAAERALARTRNNINGAAELLLTHPYLFANVDEPAPANPPEVPANPPPEVPANAEAMTADDQVPAPAAAASDSSNEGSTGATDSSANEIALVAEQAPAVPPRDWADELKKAREMMKGEVTRKSLLLLDDHPGLVFEVKTAFMRLREAEKDSDLRSILRSSDDHNGAILDIKEEKLSARCRLLALVLNDATFYSWKLPPEKAEGLMELVVQILRQVPTEVSSPASLPKWLAPIMLVAEALLMIGEAATSVKIPAQDEDVVDEPLFLGPRHDEARSLIFDICLRTLPLSTLPRDEMLSTLRLLILLTRERKFCDKLVANNGITLLMDRFKSSLKDVLAYRPHVFMILRHVIEDVPVLQCLMQYHIRRYFQSARSRIVDVQSYVRSSTPMVMRDPEAFLAVSKSTCRLLPTRTGLSYNVTIKDAYPEQKSSGAATEDMQLDMPKEPSSLLAETLVHHLLNEFIQVQPSARAGVSGPTVSAPSTQLESQGPAITPIGEQEQTAENSEYVYSCVLMQCLSELLSSYNSCKLAFVSFHKKRPSAGVKEHSGRHRTSVLNILLSEILAASDGAINPESQKKISLATWATSVIVSLCTDVYWSAASKEPSEDIVTVRKFVLDAIAKSIRDAAASESPEVRYAKLHALSDLCFRLLSSRSTPPTTNKDDPTIHIAKTMLEKNFVSILTSALADADLNYPGMKSLVGAVMRPLEHLTKVAIKMGRAAGKPKDGTAGAIDTETSSSSDDSDAMVSERDDTPDLYRTSALGMFGGVSVRSSLARRKRELNLF
ncbi:hypothetical protein FRC02_010709 [Tulasnella sp. 418]|nr:hypothetical protein FRC02_010709 [Tulasnella sp. 418]